MEVFIRPNKKRWQKTCRNICKRKLQKEMWYEYDNEFKVIE